MRVIVRHCVQSLGFLGSPCLHQSMRLEFRRICRNSGSIVLIAIRWYHWMLFERLAQSWRQARRPRCGRLACCITCLLWIHSTCLRIHQLQNIACLLWLHSTCLRIHQLQNAVFLSFLFSDKHNAATKTHIYSLNSIYIYICICVYRRNYSFEVDAHTNPCT